jgi:hypothetical protein
VNAVGATFGARPFHVRAGVIEQQPVEQFLPKEPDRGEAAARLAARYRGEDPGPVPLTPRPR